MAYRYRSSKSGQAVTRKFAAANPDTTERERIRKPTVSLVDATNWARLLLAQAAVRQIQPDGRRILQSEHVTVLRLLERWQLSLAPIIVKDGG